MSCIKERTIYTDNKQQRSFSRRKPVLKGLSKTACVFFLAMMLFGNMLFAIEEVGTDKGRVLDAGPTREEKKIKRKAVKEKLKFSGSIDINQGYDNNVDLDPQRKKDGYFQNVSNLELEYNHTKKMKMSCGVDVLDSLYYNLNPNNLLDVAPYLGLDWKMSKVLRLKATFFFGLFFIHYIKKKILFSARILKHL